MTGYLLEEKAGIDSFQLWKDLFGKYSSGETDRSTKYKEKVKGKLHEKYTP